MNHFKKIKHTNPHSVIVTFLSGFCASVLSGLFISFIVKKSGFLSNIIYFVLLIILFPLMISFFGFIAHKISGKRIDPAKSDNLTDEKRRLLNIIKIKEDK